ncbi:phytanoyl-CoA dioxygenase [Mesorhizobium sp. BR1-1-16]|uniref:phytanoyl-CoA dioxygenase n=1 Tax=Mesorhizobium sp. BR1-1-16 TaxID=2876653 RepID=UPI001CCED71F|nr:phytanoyl-CoA dioxygenase [Mesorhizobium sp. BR1-1-16]MBZ9936051.1 phytanoyl-CoA dioxygenase [Mesorhizobium sp. BR1-1-16]
MPTRLQQDLKENGFAIVRNILTPEQVRSLRAMTQGHLKSSGWYNYGGKLQVQAMHVVPGLAEILTSESVLRVLKEIAHPLDVELTFECDVMINTTSTWHKDIVHHPAFKDSGIFSDDAFRVYKMAFYLQEQESTSRSTLKVKPGSHMRTDGSGLPVEGTSVRPGDAIIFDVRIDHVGQMPTVTDKLLRKTLVALGPRLGFDVQKAFTKSRSILRAASGKMSDRMAVFMTFGPSEAWTHTYAEAARYRHKELARTLDDAVLSRLARDHVIAPS